MRVSIVPLALIVCLTSILSSFVIAQEQALPQGIIAEPAKGKISLDLRLNEDCFVPKQSVTVHFRTDRDAYVYIYNIDSKGEVRGEYGSSSPTVFREMPG